MQIITVDLRKNPDIATFVKGREPGEAIALYGTIKSNDENTLAVTVNEVGDDKPDEGDEKEKEEEDETAKPSKYDQDAEEDMTGSTGTLT